MILGVDDRQTLSLLVSRVIGACRQGELGEEGKEGEGRRKERSGQERMDGARIRLYRKGGRFSLRRDFPRGKRRKISKEMWT